MKVYTTRNWLITRSFVKEVLKYCENRPKFIIDKAPWLIKVLIWNSNTKGFGKRSLVESVFSSFKHSSFVPLLKILLDVEIFSASCLCYTIII